MKLHLPPYSAGVSHSIAPEKYYSGFRPEIILYSTAIMAITKRIWIRLLVPIPATIPKKPKTQIMIQITAINQSILLII
jgi:hypothetical protein